MNSPKFPGESPGNDFLFPDSPGKKITPRNGNPNLRPNNCFSFSQFLVGVPEKLGGAICMHYDEHAGRGQFLWTHTTASMGVAFQTTADINATTHMSRINNIPKVGTCILVESMPFVTKLSANNLGGENVNGHCNFQDSVDSSSKIQSAKA